MGKTIEDYKSDWEKANASGDEQGKKDAHAGAEAIRASQGYSGGTDGSQYIPLGNQNTTPNTNKSSGSSGSSSTSSQNTSILMPDGNVVIGYIQNGFTYMPDGSRVPIGAKVQTGGGWYEMTGSGGRQIDNPYNGVSGYMQDMSSYVQQEKDAYIQQQKGLLGAERDRQIAELEQLYERQVAEGRISIRQAETELEQQKKDIEKDYYQATQKTDLYANQMGIQNSQQTIGLKQGDQYRKGQLNAEATSAYSRRVADIRDRINGLMREKDIGVANVNAQYNAGVLSATGTASMNASNQMFGLKQTEYQNEYEKQQSIDMALMQSKLRIDEMIKSGEISEQQASIAFEREKERLAIQYGYDVSMMNMSRASVADDGYETALLRKAEMYGIDPNNLPSGASSLAQAIDQYEWSVGQKRKNEELSNKAAAEYKIERAKQLVSQGAPEKLWVSPWWREERKQEYNSEYNKKLKAYQNALEILKVNE